MSQIVTKKWGHEEIIHNDKDYCMKILHLNKGWRFSYHWHIKKKETFYVIEGLVVIQTKISGSFFKMIVGDDITILPGKAHSLYGIRNSKIVECSTQHFDEDSFRIDASRQFEMEELPKKIPYLEKGSTIGGWL
jgi:mannose-6-phosphate isomerase-like protein (cupin superfamily)